MSESDALDVVMIAKQDCLSCKNLFKQNSKTYGCLGDPNCPAKTYKIVVGLNIETYADNYAEALANANVSELTKLNKELDKVDPEIKNKVISIATTKIKMR